MLPGVARLQVRRQQSRMTVANAAELSLEDSRSADARNVRESRYLTRNVACIGCTCVRNTCSVEEGWVVLQASRAPSVMGMWLYGTPRVARERIVT